MERRVDRVTPEGRITEERTVPSEVRAAIYLNGEELVRLAASPWAIDDLALGFLYTEGIIEGHAAVRRLEADASANAWVETVSPVSLDGARTRILTSGCGKGVTLTDIGELEPIQRDVRITVSATQAVVQQALTQADRYRESGGLHTAALATASGDVIVSWEDIGRHNAVDKVIGAALAAGELDRAALLFVTGRISSEMMAKAVRAGVPVVVSLSSPTDAAVMLAERADVTLIGYARGGFMSIYTHGRRIVDDEGV